MKRSAITSWLPLWSALVSAALSGCSMGGDLGDSAGGAPSGGNVGFGGAQDVGQFRNILDEGGIPGPTTLDANGFFAEHYVELPPADCGQPLCLNSMLSVGRNWTDDSYQALLTVALTTPVTPEEIVRKPLDLVVVVDTSGSMTEDDRIGYVRQGLNLLINELQEGDRMAIVRYSDGAQLLADFADGTDRELLRARVAALYAAGSTNIYDGLSMGFELAEEVRGSERQTRVILLSDGLATAGVTSDSAIIDLAEEHVASGIGLTTIGVGRDFNIDLMRGLAERGAGNFYFVEDAAAVTEVFTEELDYFVEPLALSVLVEVEAGSAYELGEVVGTRLWATSGSIGFVSIPAVFVASRDSVEPGEGGGRRGGGSTLFIPMLARGGTEAGAVAQIRLRYTNAASGETYEQTITVESPLAPGNTPEETYVSHQSMLKQYAMYNLYLGLSQAAWLASSYTYSCALAVLERVDVRAELLNAALSDPDLDGDRALIAQFANNLRGYGASSVPEGQSCDIYEPGYGEPYYPEYPDYEEEQHMHCQAAPGGRVDWAAIFALLGSCLLITRRRRRA